MAAVTLVPACCTRSGLAAVTAPSAVGGDARLRLLGLSLDTSATGGRVSVWGRLPSWIA
jgi:hypothetical protein